MRRWPNVGVYCWPTVYEDGPTLKQPTFFANIFIRIRNYCSMLFNVGPPSTTVVQHQNSIAWACSQQTRDINPVVAQCWCNVYDTDPALCQHWVIVWSLPGYITCRDPTVGIGKPTEKLRRWPNVGSLYPTVYNISPTINQRFARVSFLLGGTCPVKTRGIHPMLFQCWPTVCDIDPKVNQRLAKYHVCNTIHWNSVGLLLGQRWANIKPTLFQRVMFLGRPTVNQRLADVSCWFG